MMNRQSCIVALCTILVGLTGCGTDGPELGSVSGVVTLSGTPVADAHVTFSPTGGRPSSATTDSSGRYVLEYSASHEGALIGNHAVRISTKRDAFSAEGEGAVDVPAREEVIPARYNTETELAVDVEAGSNTFDFVLEDGPIAQENSEKPKNDA
jgi:hypothetical protein